MAKYESNTKTARNGALYDYRENHPNASWKEIGDIFGISKARAHKIYFSEQKRREVLVAK